jgi:DNA-binding GntR family transcriptional regulator
MASAARVQPSPQIPTTGDHDAVNAPTRPRVRREQLSDEVAAHLRIGIMSGSLRPGTFIRLDETAAELGVSITPVREALRTLRGEGMVQLEPHRGHVVSPFTRGDIEDIFWLQASIASQLAKSTAERITDDAIDELERLAEAVAGAIERQDTAEVTDAEFAFHRAFNRSSGRTKLAWFLLHAARYLPPDIYANDPEWGRTAVANRRKLIAALRRHDVNEVVRLTNAQFTDGARRLTARLDELGLWT